MHKSRSLVVLVAHVALLGGCGDPTLDVAGAEVSLGVGSDGGPACPTTDPTCVEVEPPPAPDDACPSDRFIGFVSTWTGSCPAPAPGWTATQLFASMTGPGWTVSPGLAPFCAYDFAGAGAPTPGDVAALSSSLFGLVDRLDRDCRVVVPQGSEATDADWPALQAAFHAQTDRLAALPGHPNAARVRVALVDSNPDGYVGGEPGVGASLHGQAVGRIIRELGCPSSAAGAQCAAGIRDHLTLPMVDEATRDSLGGGHFGYISDLALAVAGGVNEYRKELLLDGPPRLVVNLSVAWEPVWGGAYPGGMAHLLPGPVRAAHAAITHARCWGALVVAAAGNDPTGPGAASGPMYPAAWEGKPPPASSHCAATEPSGYASALPGPAFASGVYDTLVTAVGGVDGGDVDIFNARVGGTPRLVAPAERGQAEVPSAVGPSTPTATLTGTSVAAAVASATAAAVWGYRPSLAPAEVVDLLYQGGIGLSVAASPRVADFACPSCGLAPGADQVRRLSACQSVHLACATGGGGCPAPSAFPACIGRPAGVSASATPSAAAEAAITAAPAWDLDLSGVTWLELPPLAVCGPQPIYDEDDAAYPAWTCPAEQAYGNLATPWVTPQPGSGVCPECFLDLSVSGASWYGDLYIAIDTTLGSTVLNGGTMLVDSYGTVKLTTLGTLAAGDTAVVRNIYLGSIFKGAPSRASVSFTATPPVGRTYSTTDPLSLK